MAYLRERFDHVSAERVLSGPGLENLYHAIAAVDGLDAPMRNAIDITKAALQRTCPISCAALDMFCALLGGFAGNLALTYGARGASTSPAESHRAFLTASRTRHSGNASRRKGGSALISNPSRPM